MVKNFDKKNIFVYPHAAYKNDIGSIIETLKEALPLTWNAAIAYQSSDDRAITLLSLISDKAKELNSKFIEYYRKTKKNELGWDINENGKFVFTDDRLRHVAESYLPKIKELNTWQNDVDLSMDESWD